MFLLFLYKLCEVTEAKDLNSIPVMETKMTLFKIYTMLF